MITTDYKEIFNLDKAILDEIDRKFYHCCHFGNQEKIEFPYLPLVLQEVPKK